VPEGLGSVTTTTLTIKSSPKSTTPTLLKLAVCLFPDLTVLDFIGPMTVLKILESRNIETLKASYPMSPRVQIKTTHFSHDLAPVVGDVGPELIPQRTYGEVLANFEQYDLILVPGGEFQSVKSSGFPTVISVLFLTGIHAAPDKVDPSLMEFLKQQAPGAKHILTVCSGSWILAGTGLLNGKRATTNTQLFQKIVVRSK
jgi:putative intracellular protease/amidase